MLETIDVPIAAKIFLKVTQSQWHW